MTPADPDPPAAPAEVGGTGAGPSGHVAGPAPRGRPLRALVARDRLRGRPSTRVYSLVRNLFGSASVDAGRAYDNAVRVIDLERTLHVFNEATVQSWFLGVGWFLRALNIFYGSAHFVVTAATLVWLAVAPPPRLPDVAQHPHDRHRPGAGRLRPVPADAAPAAVRLPLRGGTRSPPPTGSRTSSTPSPCTAGCGRFGNSTVQAISNQYAAMPSLHTAWALWCALVLVPRVRHRSTKVLAAVYPFATVLTIVVTANHYWLDAAGGVACVAVGWLVGSRLAAMMVKRGRGGDTVAPSPPPTAGVSGEVGPAVAPHQGHDGKEASAP